MNLSNTHSPQGNTVETTRNIGDVQDKARELQQRIAPQIDQARQNLNDLNTRALAFIKERPGTALLGALALGYVVGKLASRR
ncbi:MAG: hypothetical protein ACT4TC_03800 [Myxococcaceae bacterium]